MSDVLQQRGSQQRAPDRRDPDHHAADLRGISQRDAAMPDATRVDRAPVPDALAAGWPMFRAAAQLETVHWLIQALGAAEPLAAVTGEAGLGKTVAAAAVASQLAARGYLVISAAAPFAGPLELQALLAEGLGLPRGPHTTPAAIAAALQARGTASGRTKPAVLMLDGAERLSSLLLQYLWLMHRLCSGGRALQMVFVGRPAFWDHLGKPELADLERAIAVRTVLLPLSDEESLAYLQHRLENFGVEPAAVPRKLGQEVLALAQGVPSRINTIADAVVAQEPKRLQVTRKVIRAATAMLSGEPPETETAAGHRPLVGSVVAGVAVAAMLALWAGWGWLAPGRPVMPERVAQASPPLPAPVTATVPITVAVPVTAAVPVSVASPPAPMPPTPPHTPTPPQPVPAQSTSPDAALPAPAASEPAVSKPAPADAAQPAAETAAVEPPAPQPAAPSQPAAASAAAAPAAVTPPAATPPVMVLPDAAMPRIVVQYPAADPGVAAHAVSVVAILRARGLPVADPVAVAGPARSTTVEYYFVEDQAEATQLARELGGSVSAGRIGGRNPDSPPPPGSLRVLLSNHSGVGSVSSRESVPTSAAAPEGVDAPAPASQESP